MINKIPSVLVDYAIYEDNTRLIGTGDITLPNIQSTTTEITGAGIGGAIEIPVKGKYQSMTIQIAFRTIESWASNLMTPETHNLTLRGAQQVYDGAGGRINTEPVTVFLSAFPKNLDLGKFTPGESTGTTAEMEVLRIKIVQNSRELLEIDKLNSILRIGGRDYSSSVRADLGV